MKAQFFEQKNLETIQEEESPDIETERDPNANIVLKKLDVQKLEVIKLPTKLKSKTESMKKETNSARQRADILWAEWEDSETDGSD